MYSPRKPPAEYTVCQNYFAITCTKCTLVFVHCTTYTALLFNKGDSLVHVNVIFSRLYSSLSKTTLTTAEFNLIFKLVSKFTSFGDFPWKLFCFVSLYFLLCHKLAVLAVPKINILPYLSVMKKVYLIYVFAVIVAMPQQEDWP